jgi:hypothetical protein
MDVPEFSAIPNDTPTQSLMRAQQNRRASLVTRRLEIDIQSQTLA